MGNKNKVVCDAVIDGRDYKIIQGLDREGKIFWIKAQPKNIDPAIHTSGCHRFRDKPEQDHYDHFMNGSKWKDDNKDNSYPFRFQNSSIGSVIVM